MKKICYLMLGLLFMACSDGSEKWSPGDDDPDDPSGGGEETVIYHQRAKEMFDLVQRYYKHGNSGLYKETFPPSPAIRNTLFYGLTTDWYRQRLY